MFAQVAPQMVASPVVATTLPPTISSSTAENVAVVENQLVHVLDELEAREVSGRKMEVEVGVLGKKLAAAKHQMGLLYNDHLEKVTMWEEERGKLKAAIKEAEQRQAAAQAKVEEYEEHLDNLGKGGDMVQKKMAETARRVALLRANEALLSRKYKVLENQQVEARVNVEELNKEAAAMEARSDSAIFVSTLTFTSFRATREIGQLQRSKELLSFKVRQPVAKDVTVCTVTTIVNLITYKIPSWKVLRGAVKTLCLGEPLRKPTDSTMKSLQSMIMDIMDNDC